MLKLRLYIITGNWVKPRLLINRLSDYFERYQRPYLRIQLYMLEALIDRCTGKDTWKEKLLYGGTVSDGGWPMVEHDGKNAWVSGKYAKLTD